MMFVIGSSTPGNVAMATSFAWCAVPRHDAEYMQFYLHAGNFTEAEYIEYYVRLASGQMVTIDAPNMQICLMPVDQMVQRLGVDQLWQCAACKQFKANSLLTYCLLPTAYYLYIDVYIYIYRCLRITLLLFMYLGLRHVFLLHKNMYSCSIGIHACVPVQEKHMCPTGTHVLLFNNICSVCEELPRSSLKLTLCI